MGKLKSAVLLIRSNGLPNALRLLRNTLRKDMADARYTASRPAGAAAVNPGKLQHVQPGESGGHFYFHNAELEVRFLAPDLARISWSQGDLPVPYALAQADWPPVEVSVQADGPTWMLCTSMLTVCVGEEGELAFLNPDGVLLRSDLPPTRQGQGWMHQAHLALEECLVGLGEQAGALDLRNSTHRMWNSDPGGSYGPGKDPLYAPIPLYLGLHSRGSYLVFYENYGPANFSLGGLNQPELAEARFEQGMLRYYFIPGPPALALERYTELTGRPPLPPRWALGYHQSRWGYRSEADIREVAAGFRDHGLPISAIHLDIDYMDGFRIFTFDPERFPEVGRLSAEMEQAGIRLVTIIDPGVKVDPEYFLYQEGLEGSRFLSLPDGKPAEGVVWPGRSVFPDFSNPEVRQWWGEQYTRLLEAGIAGFWHDMNEPTSFSAWGDMTLPLAARHHMEGSSGDHKAGHNLYALLMNHAGYEALRSHRPDRRPWIISRAGWAGQQRYAWNWTGDIESSWPAIRMTIPTVLGMGLSGLPFTGPDIGGFSGNPTPEQYLRHFQMSAFLPFFRTHSAIGTARREPWVYGEPTTGILRRFLQLRYSLLPYYYSLAWEASQTGHPLIRPLFWDEPDNPELWGVDNAFLVGSTLLVAPILEPDCSERDLVLPTGGWYSFWDDRRYQGPGRVSLEAGLDSIPLLARAGSILPVEEGGSLVLNVFPPAEGETAYPLRLYTDACDGYGDARLDEFRLTLKSGSLTIHWEETQVAGRSLYPWPYHQVEVRLHGMAAHSATQDGANIQLSMNGVVISTPFKELTFQQKEASKRSRK